MCERERERGGRERLYTLHVQCTLEEGEAEIFRWRAAWLLGRLAAGLGGPCSSSELDDASYTQREQVERCVCVCVCVRERERERESECVCMCVSD